MRKFTIRILVLLILSVCSFSVKAVTKTWMPIAGGAWTTAGNWSPSGIPVTGDDVIINSNQSADITAVPTITLNSLTVSGNCLLAAGTSGDLVTITSSFYVATGITCTLGVSGNRVAFTLNGIGTIAGNVAFDGGSTVRNFTVNGTLIALPTGRIYDPALSAGSCLVVNSGATLKIGHSGGILPGGQTVLNSNVSVCFGGTNTYSTSANFEYIGTIAQVTGAGFPATVGNLTINNTAGVTLTNAVAVTTSLEINSGAKLNLNTFTTSTAGTLALNSVSQAVGTWGGTGSGATNINSTYFATAGGRVTVASAVAPTCSINLTSATNTDNQNYCVNSPIVNIKYATATATGATVTGLPAGVTSSWNANVLTISGTPTVAGNYAYLVTLTGGACSTTTTGTLISNNINYTTPNQFTRNVAITALSPNVAGTAISYSVSPALPAGLSLNTSTGVISGTPTVNSFLTTYTVTATFSCGSITFPVDIRVSGAITSVATGNWSSTSTWAGGVVPVVGDDVTISAATNVTVDITTAVCNSLNLGSTAGTGTLSFIAGRKLTVGGVVTLGNAGNVNQIGALDMTNAGTLVCQGFALDNTGANTFTPGAGTVELTAPNTLPATVFTSFNNLTISGAITTAGRALAINGALVVGTGATFSTASNFALGVTGSTSITGTLTLASTGTSTFTGDVTLNSGGFWNETGLSAINFAGNFTNNATAFTANTGIHTFSGSAKSISGTMINLIPKVAVTGTYTNTNILTVGTSLTGAGSLTQGTTGILNIGGTSTITTLTAAATGNTVNYNGATQTAKPTSYYNLTLSGSLAKTFATTPTVAGVLSMEGTATIVVTTGAVTYGTNATLQYNTNTARAATSEEWITPFNALGGVVIANTGTITINAAKVFNVNAPLTINNLATLATGNFQLSFGGDFLNNGVFTAGNSSILITNTATTQSISGFTTTGNVSMTKTGGTATMQDNINANNLTINGSGGTLNLGTGLTHTFTGTVTLSAGILNGGSSILNENATSATAWNGTGTLFTAGTSTVVFGGVAQTLATSSTFYNLTFAGTGLATKTLTGVPTVSNVLSMEGTATVSAAPTYGGSATMQYKGSGAQTTGAEFVSPFPGSGGVKINNASGVTLGSARSMGANPLTIGDVVANSALNDGGRQLTATGTLNLISGTLKLGAATATTFPAFGTRNISAGTNVEYAATTTQIIKGITYSNLIISGAGNNSKIADADITVDGIVNLGSSNASATQGSLSMSTYTLNMGATATTTGKGDVTGIVKRTNASFANNFQYSFGNQFTTIDFLGIASSVKPSWVSCKIEIGNVPSWRSVAVKRIYSFAQNGAGTDQVITQLHYLNSEINTATQTPYEPDETKLVFWDAHGTTWTTNHPHGKSNNDSINNFIEFAGLNINYLAPVSTLDNKQWGLSYSNVQKNTWLGVDGTNPTRWDIAENWTSGIPSSSDEVLIPSGKAYYPTMTLDVVVKSLELASGASLSAGSHNITLNGSTGAWVNNGTFTPGSGTVIFSNGSILNVVTVSGTTHFNNLTVNASTYLQPSNNSYIKIAGIVTVGTGSIIDLKATTNTVEYNGSGQSIYNLQGPASDIGYYNLIINGTGTTTLPATLDVMHDYTVNGGSVVATAASSISILGNVTLASGTTFTASSSTIGVAGNWTNNGATFTPGSSTIIFNNTLAAQSIDGTATSQIFYNLTVNKTSQTLNIAGSTTSLAVNNLTETSGSFLAPTTLIINGNATLTAGAFIAGTTTNILGNLTNNGVVFTAGSGIVNMNGSSAQTIDGTTSNTFNNLTISNNAGVTALVDQAVNGTLNLSGANASSTKGSLDMGSHTLNMGAAATNIGTGDVTGIVRREQSFIGNVPYTFGNQYTSIQFENILNSIKPSWLSCKIAIGVASGWRGAAINRNYSFAQDGTGTDRTITHLHYLDSELHGVETDETRLVLWDAYAGPDYSNTFSRGKSNNNSTDNWIGLAGMAINFVAPSSTLDYKQWGLGYTSDPVITWTGNGSLTYAGDWSFPGNWNGGVPTANDAVLIPTTLPGDSHGYPYRNLNSATISAVANTIEIQNGASMTVDNYDLTISGSTGAWINNGTFIPGSGKVIFNHNNLSDLVTIGGTTDFYNLEIGQNTFVRPNNGNYISIAGNLSADASAILEFTTTNNTVEFKGVDQVIINPTGSNSNLGYFNLKLSNSGTTSFPAQLNIEGNLTTNSIVNAITNSSTVILNGTAAQTINGTIPPTFLNLTVDNSYGVTDNSDLTVNGVLNLQSDNPTSNDKGTLHMTTGKILNMGDNATTIGIGDVSGIIKRIPSSSFALNTFFTLGNANTGILFAAATGQTLPTSVTLRVTIGTEPVWSPLITNWFGATPMSNPIKRKYDLAQTAGLGTRALVRAHYKDNEIPVGINESLLTFWSRFMYGGSFVAHELGNSNHNVIDNYLAIQDVNFGYVSTSLDEYQGTVAPSSATYYAWAGTYNTDWTNSSNWAPALAGGPGSANAVLIPSTYTTTFAPTLPTSSTCKSILIETNGVLNAPSSGGTLTLTGADAAWSVESGSIFNANTSTVVFANTAEASINGSTNFYNVSIANGALLRLASSTTMAIAGTLTINGTGILDAVTTSNSIEFNGTSQSIPNPNGSTPGYHNLIINGMGTTTLSNPATAVLNTLTIGEGSKLEIQTQKQLSAQTITNNAGVSGLVIKSGSTQANGSLIFHNAVENPVLATVEMFSKAYWDLSNPTPSARYKWQFFGIPVSAMVASPTFDGCYVRQYNEAGIGSGYEATKHWIQLVNSSILTPFTGYEIVQSGATTYNFEGQLINSNLSKTFSYTVGADYPGQYLLSNPYTAAIDISAIAFGDETEATVYLYNTGSYADWLNPVGGGALGVNPGQYVSIPKSIALATTPETGIPREIPSMQGFLVKKLNANANNLANFTIGINYGSMAIKNTQVQRVRSGANIEIPFTIIDVKGSRLADRMWIFTEPDCTAGFDNGWDGKKISGSSLAPQLYAIGSDGRYQVNSVADINNTDLGFKIGEDSIYTITFTHHNSETTYPALYLVDLLTDSPIDITLNGSQYTFKATATSPVNRFKIVTSPGSTTETTKPGKSELRIFSSRQTIFVHNLTDIKGDLMLYDVSGRFIQKLPFSANGITTIPTNLTPGSYVAKGRAGAEIITQSILIR